MFHVSIFISDFEHANDEQVCLVVHENHVKKAKMHKRLFFHAKLTKSRETKVTGEKRYRTLSHSILYRIFLHFQICSSCVFNNVYK